MSAKRGGILKFQTGGLAEGKQYVSNWFKARKDKLRDNLVLNTKFPVPVTGNFLYNMLVHNMNMTTASVNPSALSEGVRGVYNHTRRSITTADDSVSTAIHEWVHSSHPSPQIAEIDKIKRTLGDSFYDHRSIVPDKYLDDSAEIDSRIMQLRHALNVDPSHVFTTEEIEELKNKHIDREFLIEKTKTKDGIVTRTTVFDKNGKIIESPPAQLKDEGGEKESTVIRQYNQDNTFNILDRYSTEGIRRLLNDVALNLKDTPIYARYGIKLQGDDDKEFNDYDDQVAALQAHPEYDNIYNTFISAGFGPRATAAIMANMWQESQFNHDAHSAITYDESGNPKQYHGLLQLSNALWEHYTDYLAKNNLKNTVTNQLNYLIPIIKESNNSNPHNLKGVDIFTDE